MDFDLEALVAQAESAPGGGGSDWEDGRYTMEITRTNTGTTQENNKPKIGLLWKIVGDGPYAGQSNWDNITVNTENATSVSIFINKLVALGLSKDFLKGNPPTEQILAMLEGVTAVVDYAVKPWKSDPSKTSREFRVVKLVDNDSFVSETSSESSGGIFG